MKFLQRRVSNLIFKFKYNINNKEWEQHFLTLDYENDGVYRQKELVKIIKDSIVHFALTPQEFQSLINTKDIGEMERRSWERISKAHKNTKGDYGELLLFLILKVFFPTEKFVTKVRLRSSKKDQIKGFDCAHFSVEDDKIFLWLGEAKFHNNFSNAISGAIESIKEHCEFDYLSDEISILGSNIELNKDFPEYQKIDEILNGGKSLDSIKIKIPALLTYDCSVIKLHKNITDTKFIEDMTTEFNKRVKTIEGQNLKLKPNIEVIFIILPLESVRDIKDHLQKMEELLR